MRFASRRTIFTGATLALLAGALAACSSSTGATGNSGGNYTLTAGVLHAFTGQNAFFGLNAAAACNAAAQEINTAGGIMGHQLTCQNFDTKGDPADAVTVTRNMLLQSGHLAMVVGPDGSDIPTVLPILQQAKVPEMNTVGDPRYDTQTSQVFWRLTPSDSTQAPALAYEAIQKGYKKIVEIYTNDLSAQTTTTPFGNSYKRLGGTILKSLTITPDVSSYQTEVAQALAAHPQAIVGEMDGTTAATFLSELKQQNGKLIPVMMTQRALQGDWSSKVTGAIGSNSVSQYVTVVAPQLHSGGAAFNAYLPAIKKVETSPFQAKNPFVTASFDGVVAFALAMDAAKSTDPSAWVPYVTKVTSQGSGVTVVNTYAQGVAALKAGKSIQYIGAGGPMIFNANNTANRPYAAWTWSPGWTMGATLPQNAGQ